MIFTTTQTKLLGSMISVDVVTRVTETYHVHAESETVRDLLAMEALGLLSQGICKEGGRTHASFAPTDDGVSLYLEALDGMEIDDESH